MTRGTATAVTALAVALLLAACGEATHTLGSPDRPARITAAPRQVAMPTGAPDRSGPVDAQLVNAVCQAIRRGAPAALAPPFTRARIGRYLNEARPVARRLELSLRRMARAGGGPALRRLLRAMTSLRGLYAATPAVAHDTAGAQGAGRQVAIQEGAVSAAATDAGYPACAIA